MENLKKENNKLIKEILLMKQDKTSYRSILGLILKEGYVTINLTKKIISSNNKHYLDYFEKFDIIERTELTKAQEQEFLLGNCISEYHLKKMKAYTLTDRARKVLNSIPNLIKSINNIVKTKIQVAFNYILQYRRRKKQDRKNRLIFKNKLLDIDFAEILQKSRLENGIYGLKRVGITNCYDFYKLKLREIAKLTSLNKNTLEKIRENIIKSLNEKKIFKDSSINI